MDAQLRRRVLERVCAIPGGRETLEGRLCIPSHAFELWLAGRALIPGRVFDAAVDVILEDDIARTVQDRRRAPRKMLKEEGSKPRPARR
ncbi:MAG TPA: hypothetical protein VD965_11020 [Burkholderiales bacterium]|nr:hypothetical protein [Burkholderiales bacterium]